MKIAAVGKGGAGKTTAAAIIARSLAHAGLSIIALDCDTNPNMGIALGLGIENTERLTAIRESLDDDESERAEHAENIPELFARFGTVGPDGIQLAVVSKIEHPNPG